MFDETRPSLKVFAPLQFDMQLLCSEFGSLRMHISPLQAYTGCLQLAYGAAVSVRENETIENEGASYAK